MRPVSESTEIENDAAESRPTERAATVLGWLCGGLLGLLIHFIVYASIQAEYAVSLPNAAIFVAGAFGGMAFADRLGERAVKVLGLLFGIILGIGVLAFVFLYSGS